MLNVTIPAALLAGMLSFLSPCVLPLVPPYLVYLTGTSLERFADAEEEPRVRRETIAAALLFVLGFSTVFVALGASASAIGAVLRAYSGELATVAGIAIIIMGLHFLGLTPNRPADAGKTSRSRQAGRPVGRLSDGARLCIWLDAVHRPDPRRDSGDCGVGGHGGQGRRDARRLFARSRDSVYCGGVGRRAVRRFPGSLPRSSAAWSRRRWAAFSFSPASPFSPAG